MEEYITKVNRHCVHTIAEYTSLNNATSACLSDGKCGAVFDDCKHDSRYVTCSSLVGETVSSCGSVLYLKGRHLKSFAT